MVIFKIILKLIIIFITCFSFISADDYHCGIGSVTKFLSRVFTTGCDRERLSEICCLPHDECFEAAWKEPYRTERNAAASECDNIFKECIWRTFQSQGSYCRAMVYVTHGKVTEYFNQMCAILGNAFC